MASDAAGVLAVPSLATCRRLFETGRVRVAVECPSEDDLVWLEEFLAPTFRPRPPTLAVDYTVEAVVDGNLYQTLAATRPSGDLPDAVTFVLDQSVMRAPWWRHPPARQRVLADAAHDVLYVAPEGVARVTIVARAGGRLFRGAVMRIVREIAMARAWGRTGMVLHASAIQHRRTGHRVAGPKRSGKTSMLVHCLSAPGAAYVSNDRVLLSLAGPVAGRAGHAGARLAPPRDARPVPGAGSDRPRHAYQAHLTMAECEAASAAPPGPAEHEDTTVSPAQLCRLFRVPMAGEVPVGALLLPRVDAGSSGIGWRRLSPDEAASRFEAVVFAAGSDVRTSEAFRAAAKAPHQQLAGARSLWTRLVSRVPAFECRIGRGAFDERAESSLLPRILRALDAAGP